MVYLLTSVLHKGMSTLSMWPNAQYAGSGPMADLSISV
jgi:hypothetical protein